MWIDSQITIKAEQQLTAITFLPKSTFVVLGRSNQENLELNLENCFNDKIEILRRAGGGGTVVLYPETWVISCGAWVNDYYNNSEYFKRLNNAVISFLADLLKIQNNLLYQDGISDLCFSNKKFAGTSLFRSRNYLLYQASILVNLDIKLIDRYLAHPTKEPEYRNGRKHQEFLTDLNTICKKNTLDMFKNNLDERILGYLNKNLEDKLIQPDINQIEYLKKRFN